MNDVKNVLEIIFKLFKLEGLDEKNVMDISESLIKQKLLVDYDNIKSERDKLNEEVIRLRIEMNSIRTTDYWTKPITTPNIGDRIKPLEVYCTTSNCSADYENVEKYHVLKNSYMNDENCKSSQITNNYQTKRWK